MKKYFVILSFLNLIYCQKINRTEIIEYFNSLVENPTQIEFLENIDFYLENPIVINNSNIDLLKKLPILSWADISKIKIYLNQNKQFNSYTELFKLLEASSFEKEILKSFIAISDSDYNRAKIKFRTRVEFAPQKTTIENTIPLTPINIKMYNRFYFDSKHLSLIILTEKDQFERPITDFFSFSFKLHNASPYIPEILVGKYSILFGNGLTFWSPFRQLKTSNINTLTQFKISSFEQYKSSFESCYFDGITFKLKLSNLLIQPFFSHSLQDANFNGKYVTSLYVNGIHNNSTTRLKQNNFLITTFGIVFTQKFFNSLTASMLIANHNFNKNTYFKNGKVKSGNLFTSSLLINYVSALISVQSELSYSNTSLAQTHFCNLLLNKNIKLLINYRNLSPDFFSLFGNPLAEYNSSNEKAFMMGAEYKLKNLKIGFYIDQFKKNLSNFDKHLLSENGSEFEISILKQISKGIRIKGALKGEIKNELNNKTDFKIISQKKKFKFYIKSDLRLNKNLFFSSRFDYKFYLKENKSIGYCWTNYFKLKFSNFINTIYQISIFNTTDFNSAFYIYEYSLPGKFEFLNFYGSGLNSNLRIILSLNKVNFSLLCRIKRFSINSIQKTDINLGIQADLKL